MIDKIKNSNILQLQEIASETREQIIDVTAKNGGHIAPSLGVVELTLALLKVFNIPNDKIVWDVGHQAYAYKILTDRKDRFHTLRMRNGISGFPKISESSFDFFGTGHGGTSISSALGLKEAMHREKSDDKVIAVIGDGAMTSGLALEAMNHVEALGKNLIVVLNDNDMFISTGVGSLSKWFSRKMSGHTYSTMRNEIKTLLSKLPSFLHGDRIIDIIRKTIDSSKSLLTPGILFEGFGFQYVGPIDGHNLTELVDTMEDIKFNDQPILLHVQTVKGKGYEPAEKNPRKFHGVAPFDKETGVPSKKSGSSFTKYLSEYLPNLFKRQSNLVAITAAMPDGTGLNKLQEVMPDRIYDVGMSEAHAVTFAAGLAAGGTIPLVAIYSSFMQRAFDSVIHDVALQNLPVIFLLDRAGIVGEDGPTHHGAFDIAYMRMIPNMIIMAPRDEYEMARMIEAATLLKRPTVIRYPRGGGCGKKLVDKAKPVKFAKGKLLHDSDADTLIISVGITAGTVKNSLKKLQKKNVSALHYDLQFIKPLPEDLFTLIKNRELQNIIVVEESCVAGGAGSALLESFSERSYKLNTKLIGIIDDFLPHGSQNEIRDVTGLSEDKIIKSVMEFVL